MNSERFKKCSAKAVEVMKKKYEPLMNGLIEDLNDVDELAVLMFMLAQRVVANSILLNQEGGVDPEQTMLSILEGSQLYVEDGAAYIETQVALYNMKKIYRSSK